MLNSLSTCSSEAQLLGSGLEISWGALWAEKSGLENATQTTHEMSGCLEIIPVKCCEKER